MMNKITKKIMVPSLCLLVTFLPLTTFSCSKQQVVPEHETKRNISELKLPPKGTVPENVNTFVNRVKTIACNNKPTIYLNWGSSMCTTLNSLFAITEIAQQEYLKSISSNAEKPGKFDDVIFFVENKLYDYFSGKKEFPGINADFSTFFDGRKDMGYKNKDSYIDPSTGKPSLTKAVENGDTFIVTSRNCFPDANPQDADIKVGALEIKPEFINRLVTAYAKAMGISEDNVRFDFVISSPFYNTAMTYDYTWSEDFSAKDPMVDTIATILRHSNSISVLSDGAASYIGELGSDIYTTAMNKSTDEHIKEVWETLTNTGNTPSTFEQTKDLLLGNGPDKIKWNYNGALFFTKYKDKTNKMPYIERYGFIDNYNMSDYISFNKNVDSSKVPYDSYSKDNIAPTYYQPLDFSNYSNYFDWDNLDIFKLFITKLLKFNNNFSDTGDINFLDNYILNNKTAYDINKPCLILPVSGPLMHWDLPGNAKIAENYAKMVKYWTKNYPLNKYNYIVKGHPRENQDLIVNWCKHFFGSDWQKICLLDNGINMEILFAIDLLKAECFHRTSDDLLSYNGHQLINPRSFKFDQVPQTQFADIADFDSSIFQSIPYLLKKHFDWNGQHPYYQKLYTDKTVLLPYNYPQLKFPIPSTIIDEKEKIEWTKNVNKLYYSNLKEYKISWHIDDFFSRDWKSIVGWTGSTPDIPWYNPIKMIIFETFNQNEQLYDLDNNNYWKIDWFNSLESL